MRLCAYVAHRTPRGGFDSVRFPLRMRGEYLLNDHLAIIAERIQSFGQQTICLSDVVASVLYCHAAAAADVVI